MATTSIPHRWKYDVFVSFRGEDIRKTFMDHLFNDFKQKGIYAFRDDRELPKGEEISPHLYKAIEESRFLIVIFSKDYASSSWCLQELVKILECKQIECPRYEVQTVFYDVKPDVVRKQTDSYAEAFAKHQRLNRPEVDNWKEALTTAANLSGWDLQDMTNGYEYKFIDCLSKDILKKLCDGPLHVGENLVGIDFHFDRLDLSRFVASNKVNMIGICGISGIGKTTLAKAIYNLMYIHFEGSCFCEDVRKQQDLTRVQMQLIDNIMKTRALKISSVGQGIMVIKKMMSSKKPILLILDDVDDHEQLEALAGSAGWFCPGSLIIFTGKDKQLLRSHRVDEIHDMDFLDEDRSLELFRSYAFKEKDSSIEFKEVSQKVVQYVQGHPLALKVLGRFLYEKTVGQWLSELEKLKVYPNEQIQRVLRLSYDGLDLHQKNILLDIACLFVGENTDLVASVLDGCNFFADTNMKVLVDKSLITISSDMSLQMHDLIQAMARGIVREESIMPGKQRRLWNSSEVYNVLSEKKVPINEAIEVLVLLLRESSQKVHINANSFALMKNLRILKIYVEEEFPPKLELKGYDVNYSGHLYFLSNELSLFCWHEFPFKYLPCDFYPPNIVVIDLSYSKIKQLWTTPKCLRRLKVMKLRYCCNLTTTPDFSEITNLEVLDLEGCVNMVTVHPSIGMLKRLLVLNMRDCRQARRFPSKVEMDSLRVLNLAGCLKVDQLPEALGRIKSLTELHVDRTGITEIPSFVSSLKNLESLSIGGQGRIQPKWWTSITAPFGLLSKQQDPQRSVSVSLGGLHMLKSLSLSYCNIEQVSESIGGLSCLKYLYLDGNNLLEVPESIGGLSCPEVLNLEGNNLLEVPESIGGLSCLTYLNLDGNNLLEVPESIGGLSCLQHLQLSGNNFTILPESLSHLSHLSHIWVDGCKKLEVLPELPPRLFYFHASDCISLREVAGSSKDQYIDSERCISKTQCLDSSITSQGFIHHLSSFLGKAGLQTPNRCEFFLQDSRHYSLNIGYYGNSMPEWFTNRSTGNDVKVELASDWCYDKFRGFGTCVVFKGKKPFYEISVRNFNGALIIEFEIFLELKEFGKDEDYIWLHYTRYTEGWKEAKNFVTFSFFEKNNEDFEVKEMGVRLICDEDLEQGTDLSMLQGLPTPTQLGGRFHLYHERGHKLIWSW